MAETQSVKRRDPIYITIIILLLGAGGFCGYQWYHFSAMNELCDAKNADLEGLIHEMEADMGSAGFDLMSTDIRENLQSMLAEMDTLQTDNQAMQDSITAQRERVTGLLAELDEMKAKGKRDARTIYKLRRETETLRKVMRMQVHKIDSLHRLNLVYEDQIEQQEKTIEEKSGQIQNLTNDKTALEEKVDIGSKLSTAGMKADALRVRSSGSYKETPRARNTNMIRACFTIMANPIAKPGEKVIYMRIIGPDGNVVNDGNPVGFEVEGVQKEASIKRAVDYRNENMDLCIFYTVPEGDEVKEGDYIVKMYCEGKEIASTSFSLK